METVNLFKKTSQLTVSYLVKVLTETNFRTDIAIKDPDVNTIPCHCKWL